MDSIGIIYNRKKNVFPECTIVYGKKRTESRNLKIEQNVRDLSTNWLKMKVNDKS